jgi:acyl carrier protein
MELQDFVAKFAAQFEETEASKFQPDTEFKTLEEWTSLTALTIIAMVADEYDVTIKGNDIRESETIEELYNIVKRSKS